MKLLAVVTPPSIYHGCSTRKTLWEEKFTVKKYFFLAVNMKICGRFNVRKHKEIKGSDNYVTSDISSNFDSLENMKIVSSESKRKLEISGNCWLTIWVSRPKQGHKNTKSQGMPSEISARRTPLRLLGSLRNLRNYLMRRRGPNMSLLRAAFT